MNRDELKGIIKEQVQLSIKEHMNPEQVNESVADIFMAGGSAVGGGILFALLRNMKFNAEASKLMKKFLETYDNKNIINQKFPDLFKRFKLINSLSDLERMENQVEKYMNELEMMEGRVDEFVEKNYREEKSFTDNVLIRNPQKSKVKLKKTMRFLISETKQAFQLQFDRKRDELLS